MKLSRINLCFEFDGAGCFVGSTLSGSIKDPVITLKLNNGSELPMFEKDLVSVMGQLETVLKHLGVLRGDIKERGVSIEDINNALLTNTLGIGASGLVEPNQDRVCVGCGNPTGHVDAEYCITCAQEIVNEMAEEIGASSIDDDIASCCNGSITNAILNTDPTTCEECVGCGGLPGKAVYEARTEHKIQAIIQLRNYYPNLGLREAKHMVEGWMDQWKEAIDDVCCDLCGYANCDGHDEEVCQ